MSKYSKIDEVIENNEPLSIKEVSDMTGISRSSVKRYLVKIGYEYNRASAWNKGLTKEDNDSLLSMSEKKKVTGWKHDPDTKKKISESMKEKGGYREGAGSGTAYYYGDDVVASNYELEIAKLLDEEGIKWEKENNHNIILGYKENGITRTVSVEFYLNDYDIYLTVKYNLQGEHRKRLALAEKQNGKKILIIDQLAYKRIMYNSVTHFLKNSLQIK